jgi:hypothetical protein
MIRLLVIVMITLFAGGAYAGSLDIPYPDGTGQELLDCTMYGLRGKNPPAGQRCETRDVDGNCTEFYTPKNTLRIECSEYLLSLCDSGNEDKRVDDNVLPDVSGYMTPITQP